MRAVLWFLIFPALFAGLLFGVYLPGYHYRAAVPHPAPFSCAQLVQSVAAIDGGSQIAPLCGQEGTP